MLPLREYLAQRRAEVQAQIKALRAELSEIDAAASALGGEGTRPSTKERGTAGSGKKTLKELALNALHANPDGLDAHGILAWIKEKYGLEIARESMSPQLSRLGQENKIKRDGLIWSLHGIERFTGAPQEPCVEGQPENDGASHDLSQEALDLLS